MKWLNQHQYVGHQYVLEELLSLGWIKTAQWFPEIDSTNDAARRALVESSLVLPALFVADQQTAGRGRNHRQWWSPSGCLMLTLAIDGRSMPDDPSDWSQLALVCGIAVAKTAAQFVGQPPVQLKWPNDVFVKGKKIAGILIESAPSPRDSCHRSPPLWLVGLGMNIDIAWGEAPQDLATKATCLSTCAGRSIDRKVALVELTSQLQQELGRWRDGDPQWIADWRDRCLLSGRIIHARVGPLQQTIGLCEGVDSTGRLMVRNENGLTLLAAGEVLAWQ